MSFLILIPFVTPAARYTARSYEYLKKWLSKTRESRIQWLFCQATGCEILVSLAGRAAIAILLLSARVEFPVTILLIEGSECWGQLSELSRAYFLVIAVSDEEEIEPFNSLFVLRWGGPKA